MQSEVSGAEVTLHLDVQWGCSQMSEFPSESELFRWARAAITESTRPSEVTIRIVGRSEMKKANYAWRQKNRATNVLSFPADFPEEAGINYLGDILICADILREECVEQGKSLYAHWAHIVVHGMLHLQGFDHVAELHAAEMEALEVEILASLDYNNPYESATLESGKS